MVYCRRFIPARAGNIGSGSSQEYGIAVHPRSCGEHANPPTVTPRGYGSSPLVRGTWLSRWNRTCPDRFIPARAGNISFSQQKINAKTVHPRSCGEHPRADALPVSSRGSSPLVRGTSRRSCQASAFSRFIPARAGNMASLRPVPVSRPVHPRSCGEHSIPVMATSGTRGSSPLVRGTYAP